MPSVPPPGTGTTNSGLFTRQTIGGVLNGWDDPLISVASTLTLPPGVSLPAAYSGMLGPYRNETNTAGDLVAAIAAGTADAADYVTFRHIRTWDPTDLRPIFDRSAAGPLIPCSSVALSGVRGLLWQGRRSEQLQICLFPGFHSMFRDWADLWPPRTAQGAVLGRGCGRSFAQLEA